MNIKGSLIIPLLILSIALSAQESSDYNDYMEKAGNRALLYRGKAIKKYHFKYDGTYYAYQEEYLPGTLYYNKKWYSDIYLNLNSHTGELYIKPAIDAVAVGIADELVEKFSMGKMNFVRRDGIYYQVIYQGKNALYKQISKLYREEIDHSSQVGISGFIKLFDEVWNYYFVKDDVLIPVSNKRDFYKLFPSQKKEIKKQLSLAGYNKVFLKDKDKDGAFTVIITTIEQ